MKQDNYSKYINKMYKLIKRNLYNTKINYSYYSSSCYASSSEERLT